MISCNVFDCLYLSFSSNRGSSSFLTISFCLELQYKTLLFLHQKQHYLDAHAAAQKGDVEALRRIAKTNPTSFTSPDDNGWTPFHEAVRVGNKEAVEIILNSEVGKSLQNRLTYTGVTPLNIAREFLGNDNEVTKFLVELGAIDKHPHRRGSMTRDEL